jgi:hypothetical protein
LAAGAGSFTAYYDRVVVEAGVDIHRHHTRFFGNSHSQWQAKRWVVELGLPVDTVLAVLRGVAARNRERKLVPDYLSFFNRDMELARTRMTAPKLGAAGASQAASDREAKIRRWKAEAARYGASVADLAHARAARDVAAPAGEAVKGQAASSPHPRGPPGAIAA